jgi:hypothetical protein
MQEVACGRDDPVTLVPGDALGWAGKGAMTAEAHLYEHQQLTIQHDQIDLAAGAVEISGNQR